MNPDAPAPQRDPRPPATASPSLGARIRRRWGRAVLLAFLGAWIGMGTWHATKPLPPGLSVASPWTTIPADDLRLLLDTTAGDAFGRVIVNQQIFDETLRIIREAREFVVLDQFLFNAHAGSLQPDAPPVTPEGTPPTLLPAQTLPTRRLSAELGEALVAARREHPQLRVLFITDPINDVYGGDPSPQLARLREAGIDVVLTDLDRLRDSNPFYSGLWRFAIDWWSGDGRGRGWLPNPLEDGPSEVTFRAWARLLNLKANHRKTIVADDGAGGLVGMVSSANPHDASSAHSNIALEVRGAWLRDLIETELAVARFSGWRGEWPLPPAAPPVPAPRARFDAGEFVSVRVLTEGAIRDALVERISGTRAGDRVQGALFYLSDRAVIEALLAAAQRGVQVDLILDPNRDAFGRQKNGIPNRPVASELVSRSDGAIRVRWYRTRGEQFHAKAVAVVTNDRFWLTAGSANLTRRNIGDFNLETNLAVESALAAPVAVEYQRWFDTLWSNRGPVGVEYTADFGTFADPAQTSYWAYRIMEATGLSTF